MLKKRVLAVAAVLGGLVALGAADAPAQTVMPNDWARVVSVQAPKTNNSTTVWKDAIATVVALPPGRGLVIHYAAETSVSGAAALPNSTRFRVLVDNVALPQTPQAQCPDLTRFGMASYTWFRVPFSSTMSTSHLVRIQFRPYGSGDTSWVQQQTLVIEY